MIQRKAVSITKDEVIKLEWDWSAELERRSTSLSSSTWRSTDSGITISGTSISGNKTLATLTASHDPQGSIINTAVLANGETLVAGAYYE